jgi:hypothetical protein
VKKAPVDAGASLFAKAITAARSAIARA